MPPTWNVARGGEAAGTATGRVENANAAARVEPRREGYYNAIQIYPWSEGALYQVYAAVGQITTIALEPGESPQLRQVRFRTLGCYPLTGAVESEAKTLSDIIQEMLLTTTSERQGRAIDKDAGDASMEKKKQEGYF